MNRDYDKLLMDSKWRIKRADILRRDEKKCTVCSSKKLLEIHHTFYYSNYPEPWEYPDESLLTLCKKCHREYHENFDVTIKEPPKKLIKKKKKIITKKAKKIKKQNIKYKTGTTWKQITKRIGRITKTVWRRT